MKYTYYFIEKNPNVFQVYNSRVIDKQRNNVGIDNIISYLNVLNSKLNSECGVNSSLLFNLDEIGFGDIQRSCNIKVVRPPCKHTIPDYPVPPGIKRITALVTVFLDGTSAMPFIVDPNKTLHRNVLEKLGYCKSFIYRYQENGFMNEELFIDYIQCVLFPEIQRRRITFKLENEKAIAIFDGCSSHCTTQVKNLLSTSIDFVIIPPHSSHILQPLDTSIFHLIKNDFRHCFENVFNIQMKVLKIYLELEAALSALLTML